MIRFAAVLGVILSAGSNSALADTPGVRAVAYSPDGKLFAACTSGSAVGELAVWNAQTWELKFVHREKVGFSRVAFSPDSRMIALSRYAPEAGLFDAESGKMIGQLIGHSNHACCAVFTPDGSQIITGSFDRSVKIWDTKSQELQHTITDAARSNIYHVDISRDGALLAVTDGREYVIRLFDLNKLQQVRESPRMGSLVPHVAFSPEGHMVAASSWGGYCRVYETESLQLKFELNTNSADWACFSNNGKIAVAAGKSVYVYDFPVADHTTKHRIAELIAHFEQDDYEVRESASEGLKNLGGVTEPFLAAAMDSKIPEVRIRTRRVRDYLMTVDSAKQLELGGEAECAVFSPAGTDLVTGDKYGNLVVWNVDKWTRQRELQLPR